MIFMKPNRDTVYKKKPANWIKKKTKVYIRQPSKTESIPNGKEIKYKGYKKITTDIKDKQLINWPPLKKKQPQIQKKTHTKLTSTCNSRIRNLKFYQVIK